MSVKYGIIFLFTLLSVLLGFDDQGCDSPQYLQLGKTGVINCFFEEGFYGVFWYGSTDTARGNPILEYVDSRKDGTGYSTGEFDIQPNGSLIINNVSLTHDRNFAVLKFQSKTEDPLRFAIKVIVTARPSPPYPVIGECGNASLPCIVDIHQPSSFNCFVGQARPPVNLTWVAHTAKGNLNITSEMFVTNGSDKYTSRVQTMESFFHTALLTLLICKANSPPSMLTKYESFILVQNINSNFSFSSPRPATQFVEHASKFVMACTEHDFELLVWKRKSHSDDRVETILYSILGEKQFTKVLIDSFETSDEGSLIIPNVGIDHEGVYNCIYSNGVTESYRLYNLLVYVNPAVKHPIVDGCNQQQRCVKEVTRKGNLTCSVSGIRPEVQLEWVAVSDDTSSITFTNHQRTTNTKQNTFDITTTVAFQIESPSQNRLTVKCQMSGPNSAIFRHATTVDLLILTEDTEPTDGPISSGGTNAWILAVVPVILVLLLSGIATVFCRKRRRTTSIPAEEEVQEMLSSHNTDDYSAKKEVFKSQLQGKYEDLYYSVRPIPYISEKMYCVNDIFVEGGIKIIKGKPERLGSYKDILNDGTIKSTRYILEGEPGVGKSTLSLQFAHDWCNDALTSSDKKVDLLILLRLRQLGGVQSIYRAIKQFLLPQDSSLTELDVQTLVENSESCVIILDGYDEYPELNSDTSYIDNIITRKILQQFQVILTTRVGCLPKNTAPVTQRLRLTGFDDKARELYISKVFGDGDINTVEDIEQRLKDNPFLGDLCEIPLFFAMFVHVCHDYESPEKFKTVTHFFSHIISCLHSHMKNKMKDENVKGFELFEKEHKELEKLAFESLNKQSQEFVWNKDEICKRLGEGFYEQYKLIGMLVEETLVYFVEKPGMIDSEFVKSKIQVRFYHNLFCEWYAAHFLAQLAERPEVTFDDRDQGNGSTGPTKNVINLDYLDPVNLQYVFRFACGLSSVTADKIFQYLKGKYGGDRYETLCIMEKTGVFDNIKREILDICSSPVSVHDHHTKLQQRSTIQLLEIASSKQIPVVQLRLENCFSKVDRSKKVVHLKSGVTLSNLNTLKELHIEESGKKMNTADAEDILWYSSICKSLKTIKFVECLPPQSINVESLHSLRSRDARVSWVTYFSVIYDLNLQSGVWQHEDGTAMIEDEYKEEITVLEKATE